MKKFFAKRKLKKSKSLHDKDAVAEEGNNNQKGGGPGILKSSKTFAAPPSTSRSCGHPNGITFETSTSLADIRSTASFCSEKRRAQDSEMDKQMMQMISDVKYVKRRPKFMAVGEVNFQRQCLEAHNQLRNNLGCPSLAWSQELSELARTWAIKLADKGRILYPEIHGIGENIYLDKGVTEDHLTTGTELVTLWAKEGEFFNFEKPMWHPKCQKFTQMIWRESEELGICRYWNTTSNCLCIVAFYRPAGNGNAPGQFVQNVPSRSAMDEEAFDTGSPIRTIISSLKKTSISGQPLSSPLNGHHASPLARKS
uniref:SCP domain-containing protein n=1 Tax=Rhabditophanes sp. KR3021 TaxID=114890 RepID=A0AC35TW32_9BILA